MSAQTVLITGGASQTGLALAKLVDSNPKYKAVFTSRSGRGVPEVYESVKLDWYDPSTYGESFKNGRIDTVYLLPPPADATSEKVVNPFIDVCIEKGVKRFILLADCSWSISRPLEEAPFQGLAKINVHLDQRKKEGRIEYLVLRPTWFTENFGRFLVYGIRARDELNTPVPTGKIPFVSVDDIAQAGYDAIVSENPLEETEKVVIGPDLLSYPEAASIISQVTGRTITHRGISNQEQVEIYSKIGVPSEHAKALGIIHAKAEDGADERWWNEREKGNVHIGKVSVREWVQANKQLFEKDS
ncbi:nucleoside-diphosphate-sugar epimerase [Coprinopsis cinerea okayama7|uniref:Nucleoside-diphosphate-sugar epimerase n=1 Tax=Coprinopsis cinerea (strain Okayama-7 / 130 / ATCC MYA-4618 / FGSC 9003) TaxID=240176 RepID=A8P337_COPC7|nr:nucleoside-diphosphate-sugar epimerase [Coprinopsis cinerea okayama7\|eukprot:XP_001838464.1 nucleoside-diphosphate-sugar epimerase [Coprinopsis cinerea okayama7\